jgi:hypothetical protein
VLLPRQQAKLARGTKDKEHAMSQTPNTAIAVIGIDIGKNSFHVVGHNARGAIVLRQKWSRGQVEARLANIPPCLIGMEACVGAHHLSRKLDRTRSPVAVSGKREYFKYPPETIADFAPAAANFGARRPTANWQKPPIGGRFRDYRGQNLQAPDWLAGAGGFEPSHGEFTARIPKEPGSKQGNMSNYLAQN